MIPLEKDVRVRVAGILIQNKKLLLIAHKKDENKYWLLPGGGVNYGESLEEALKREFLEELNILIDVNQILLVSDSIDPDGEKHIVNICFDCFYNNGEYILGDEKRLYDFAFFDKNELLDIKIFPPINKELISIMNNEKTDIYLGRIWMK